MRRNVPMKATLPSMLFTATALVLGSLSVARADSIPQTTCGNLSTEVFAPNLEVPIGSVFTDIASLTITVGGSVNGCLVVSFSGALGGIAEPSPPGPPSVSVRAVLDQTVLPGNTPSGVGAIAFPVGSYGTYVFVFTNVPPGDHSLRIQGAATNLSQPFALQTVAVISHP